MSTEPNIYVEAKDMDAYDLVQYGGLVDRVSNNATLLPDADRQGYLGPLPPLHELELHFDPGLGGPKVRVGDMFKSIKAGAVDPISEAARAYNQPVYRDFPEQVEQAAPAYPSPPPPPAAFQPPARRLPLPGQAPPLQQQPTTKVTAIFETSMGQVSVEYADILVSEEKGIMVLVGRSGSGMQFTPKGEKVIPCLLPATSWLYGVQPTGIDFEYNGYHQCVLKIMASSFYEVPE